MSSVSGNYYYSQPPVSRPVEKELTISLAQLLNSAEVRTKLENTLATSDGWEKVCVELSKSVRRITGTVLSNIRYASEAPAGRSREFVKQLLTWPEVSAEVFVKAVYAAGYQVLADGLRKAAATAVALPAPVAAPVSLLDKYISEFLNTRIGLRAEIIQTLAGSQGDQRLWEAALTMLVCLHERVTSEWIPNIKMYQPTPYAQSEAFLTKFGALRKSDVRTFVTALAMTDASLKPLCEKICTAAGVPEFVNSLLFPSAAIKVSQFPQASLAKDDNAEELAVARAQARAMEQQMKEIQKKNEELSRRLEQAAKQSVEERAPNAASVRTCAVCFEPRDLVAVVPCGHVVHCAECIQKIASCTFCRGVISQRLPLFFAGE